MSDLIANEPSEPIDFDAALARVDAALTRGEFQESHALADELRRGIDPDRRPAAEAHVDLRLAYCDFHMSRIQRAHAGAQHAARKFREHALLSDEVEALSLWSRSASRLGRSIEAVETALLATRLSDGLDTGIVTARAYMSLGIAYGWANRYAQAARAFETTVQLADRIGSPEARLEVSLERHWVLALRGVEERLGQESAGRLEGLAEIDEHLARCNLTGGASALTPGAAAGLAVSAAAVCSLMALWSGHAEQADAWLARCAIPGEANSSSAWLLMAQSWVRAETARRREDFEAAGMHASRMTSWAAEAEHLPLSCVGHRLASETYLLQGHSDEANNELRQLMLLERKMQAHGLDSRERVVDHQLFIRESTRQIETLAAESSKLYRWAHEDALTGLANLRRFDQCLTEWSAVAADTGRPLCVALIDVDHFKHVNDTFGHPVGDKVLRAIAGQMIECVRVTDLPARWGGDEFAILFRDTDMAMAEQVALRLEQAVRAHDWTALATGLDVSVSIGVVEAQPRDTKQTLVTRSDTAMYARKRARHLAEVERTVPKAVLRRVTGWLRQAERVVLLVGSGTADNTLGGTAGVGLSGWSPEDRARVGHVSGMQRDPGSFGSFWQAWRRAQLREQPTPTHLGIVALSHLLQQPTIVTERVDGLLAKAGAVNVIELYGNAFRDRCGSCGCVSPSRDNGRCLACNSPERAIRPDIVLLGESPEPRLLAGTELVFKRADVVLVVDCDATTWPGAGLLEKAKTRGAKVVMLGAGHRARRDIADVSIPLAPSVILKVLQDALEEGPSVDDSASGLTAPGFEVLCFLTGQGTDDRGTTLDQALQRSNWEIERRLGTIPWMFPLLTRSRMSPSAPMPTREDFAVLAGDEAVRDGMRRAFTRMLRFYGFEWRDRSVERASGWREGFATWALTSSHHDWFISRILGSLTLLCLKDEAEAFLRTLESEVTQYRGARASVPLHHWRLALRG